MRAQALSLNRKRTRGTPLYSRKETEEEESEFLEGRDAASFVKAALRAYLLETG